MSALTPPVTLLAGDCRAVLATLPPACVQCVVTSPPFYAKRDYGTEPQVWGGTPTCEHEWAAPLRAPWANEMPGPNGCVKNTAARSMGKTAGALCRWCGAWCGQLGQEPTPDLYVAHLVEVFRAVGRVLRDDGVLFLNIGDTFGGNRGNTAAKPGFDNKAAGPGANLVIGHKKEGATDKQLLLIPARVALALQADGWILRNELIWAKAAPMPESMTDRWTCAHEQIFLFSKRARYFCDMTAVAEPTVVGDHPRNQQPRYQAPGQPEHTGLRAGDGPGTRNPRDVWALGPEAFGGEHYATFPSEIPRRAILAGTSAHGACAVCGAPWRRVVERTAMVIRRTDWGDKAGNRTATSGTMLEPPTARTVGWAPTCKHADAAVVPCVVGDPFAGSGTTLAVAKSLGRHAVGSELQADYLPLIEARLAAVTPWWEAARAPVAAEDFGPLFAQVPA